MTVKVLLLKLVQVLPYEIMELMRSLEGFNSARSCSGSRTSQCFWDITCFSTVLDSPFSIQVFLLNIVSWPFQPPCIPSSLLHSMFQKVILPIDMVQPHVLSVALIVQCFPSEFNARQITKSWCLLVKDPCLLRSSKFSFFFFVSITFLLALLCVIFLLTDLYLMLKTLHWNPE